MTAKSKAVTVSTFALGMNNRRPDFKLRNPEGPGYFMREIVNADVLANGPVKRRRGYAQALVTTVGGSLYADDTQAYFASGAALLSLADVAGVLTPTTVTGAALVSGAPVSFAPAPSGGAYWTDGTTLGHVLSGASLPLAPPTPAALPVVTTGSSALEPGLYRYCFSYSNAVGRESGATHPVVVSVAAAGSLIFTLAANTPAGLTLNIYVSLSNGSEMYLAAQRTTAGASTVGNTGSFLSACMTVGLVNMPAGRLVRYSLGRLVVAVGPMLYFSRPYMSGLYDPTRDFIPFTSAITVIEEIPGVGLFIVADKTYWLGGDLSDTKLETVLPFGAALGSGCRSTDGKACFWMSHRGIARGTPGGEVELLQDENVAVDAYASGATLPMDINGVSVIVSAQYGAAAATQAAGDSYASSEVVELDSTDPAWVVDDTTKASWRYTNYGFTCFAEIGGRYFGGRATGVYLLEGDNDAGATILATVDPGRQDFRSTMRKRMESAYLLVSSPQKMRLTITDDEARVFSYTTRRADVTIQQQRIDVGRGLDGAYMAFQITNEAGADFELSGFELMAVEVTRRLR